MVFKDKNMLKDIPRKMRKTIDFAKLNRTIYWRKKIAEEQEKLSKRISLS